MAKWGTYPPDEQLRLKRAAAEELYEALSAIASVRCHSRDDAFEILDFIEQTALRALEKARGDA